MRENNRYYILGNNKAKRVCSQLPSVPPIHVQVQQHLTSPHHVFPFSSSFFCLIKNSFCYFCCYFILFFEKRKLCCPGKIERRMCCNVLGVGGGDGGVWTSQAPVGIEDRFG